MPFPEIEKLFASGTPACTPALDEMGAAWKTITSAADPWLDALTVEKLQEHVLRNGEPSPYLFGSLLQRVIYHYWYHLGENMAIRQILGHKRLAQFVGDLDGQAPYSPKFSPCSPSRSMAVSYRKAFSCSPRPVGKRFQLHPLHSYTIPSQAGSPIPTPGLGCSGQCIASQV